MSKRRPKHHATEQPCGVCDRPVFAAFVCRDCMDRYHGHLARVPGVVQDLRVEHTRQAVKGGNVTGRGSAEQPLPYIESASNAMTALYAALTTACRIIALDQPLPTPGFPSVCAWLAQREASIPLRAEGPDIVSELDRCIATALRVCDNPPEKALRGRCACGEELRSAPGAAVVQCQAQGCRATYRGDILDEVRDAAVRDHLAPWEELAAYATQGLGIPRQTVASWQENGKLVPIVKGKYRVADLITLDERRLTRRKAG